MHDFHRNHISALKYDFKNAGSQGPCTTSHHPSTSPSMMVPPPTPPAHSPICMEMPAGLSKMSVPVPLKDIEIIQQFLCWQEMRDCDTDSIRSEAAISRRKTWDEGHRWESYYKWIVLRNTCSTFERWSWAKYFVIVFYTVFTKLWLRRTSPRIFNKLLEFKTVTVRQRCGCHSGLEGKTNV